VRRLAALVVSLTVLLAGLAVGAPRAEAQEGRGAYAPVIALCIRKIVNLPGVDLPDQPIDVMFGGQVDCPPRGG
jgi:hypothetical protein